jgi:hypothetical protein
LPEKSNSAGEFDYWRVEGSVGVWVETSGRCGRQLRSFNEQSRLTLANTQHAEVLLAKTNQAHPHKHYCFNPFTDLVCEFWVFRIRVSLRRLNQSDPAPSQAVGLGFALDLTGGTDFSNDRGGT